MRFQANSLIYLCVNHYFDINELVILWGLPLSFQAVISYEVTFKE